MEVDRMFYIKPNLKNMSQGARLEYIREFRHMTKEDVAAYYGFGGKEPNKCFDSMMNNKVNLCFIFQLNIFSFSGVKTEMLYKLWISKDKKGKYNVINSNSTIKDNIVE